MGDHAQLFPCRLFTGPQIGCLWNLMSTMPKEHPLSPQALSCRCLSSPVLCEDITLPGTNSSAAAEVQDQGGGLEGEGVVCRARSSSDLTSKWHIRGIIYHRQRHRKMYFEEKKQNKKNPQSCSTYRSAMNAFIIQQSFLKSHFFSCYLISCHVL